MKKKKLVTGLFILFICLLSLTIYTSFSSNIDEQEIVIKSMTPVCDETSTIEVDNNNVVFNDKNQVVKYNVVLENTQDYDVKISDIKLSTPTEEFLDYKVEGISTEDEIKDNSTKELTISFETTGIKGWGRNFSDELTANISFEKVSKQEETPPVEEDKEEEKQPEAPATNTEELISKTEKIEIIRVTKDTIEFKETNKLETGDKIAVWLYSEPIFLGYFNVVETNNVKQIVGLEEALSKVEINPGKHNIVLATEEGEAIGYVSVGINEEKEISMDNTQTTPDKEESGTTTKPSTDSDSKDDKGDKVENPYTSNNGLVVVFGVATFITGIAIIFLCNKKVAKYTVFILMLSPAFTITNAEEVIEVSIKNNVSFESQNVMKMAYTLDENNNRVYHDYWSYANIIKDFYIQNEIIEIGEYAYKFDVTEGNKGKVMAYLVERKDHYRCDWGQSRCYDLYLQADGIIYPNDNASHYFASMRDLGKIDNLPGMDTSEVISMQSMFELAGMSSTEFTLDLSSFDTSKVTDMSYMFADTGYESKSFTLDVSSFDTSNVTNMRHMFASTGTQSEIFTLDLSNFDTSKVTDMSSMFDCTGSGYENKSFTLDVSNFDTSNVTDMSSMFAFTGFYSTDFILDISNFDFSKVVNMANMFNGICIGANNQNIELTIKNPNISVTGLFEGATTEEGTQIIINYTNKTKGIANRILDTKEEAANIVLGEMVEVIEGDELSIGDEVAIGNEYFNIVSQTDNTVTMLAQYNLGTDYRQSSALNSVKFAAAKGWEYTPGPKEIDIQKWSTNPKTYVNAYVEYLKEELDDDSVIGDLITIKELEKLGCVIPSDYAPDSVGSGWDDSPYGWLYNGQEWWTRSAVSSGYRDVWVLHRFGFLDRKYDDSKFVGIRPVITISKDTLKKLNS